MAATRELLSPTELETVQTLRRSLHACAERSREEGVTASRILEFVSAYAPDRILTQLGGHGVAAVYEGQSAGPTLMIRADLDAVLSQGPGEPGTMQAAHTCGHDGHMSIVAGLAPLLQRARPRRGRVVLLFQPAEETGEGASEVIADPRFAEIRPDCALALHNIPGAPLNRILSCPGPFASASVGMRSQITGISSHAAQPEMGKSPAKTLSQILARAPGLSDLSAHPYRLLTVTHARLGSESYGVCPGDAMLCATLRSASLAGLEKLKSETEALLRASAEQADLAVDIRWLEAFPAVRNDAQLHELLCKVCADEAIELETMTHPFRWSEDFGHFSTICPTLFFGLGIGEHAAPLHRPDYRFPDEVLPTGIAVFSRLIEALLAAPPQAGWLPR